MKKKRRYRCINKTKIINKTNWLSIFIFDVMIIMGIIFIKMGLDVEKNILPTYTYTAEKSDNYEVILKPNEFYLTPTLPSGRYYASNSINSFLINLKYDFKSNKKIDLGYNYNIIANLVGIVKDSNSQDKEIWNREFVLLETKNNKLSDNNEFFINEKVNIDYEAYNKLARLYEDEYNIKINAILQIRLNVYYENVEDFIQLDIPVTTTITNVEQNYEPITYTNIYPNIEGINTTKTIYCMIGLIFIISGIVIIVIKLINNKNKMTPEENYKQKINHIIKYYKEIIVTVENEPDLTNLKIMKVAILDDLIDLAEQNQTNIIYYEVIENEKSNFYVIIGNCAYVYTLI